MSLNRLNGCLRGCPHYAKTTCPYGVGLMKYPLDVIDANGDVIRRGGDVVDVYRDENGYAKGICPDRVAELKSYMQQATSVNGLRVLRAENLAKMKEQMTVLDETIRSFTDKTGLLVEYKDKEGVPYDAKVIEAVKELSVLMNKYHEKIDNAFAMEARLKDNDSKRMSADDINAQIKKAKAIDISQLQRITPASLSSNTDDAPPSGRTTPLTIDELRDIQEDNSL